MESRTIFRHSLISICTLTTTGSKKPNSFVEERGNSTRLTIARLFCHFVWRYVIACWEIFEAPRVWDRVIVRRIAWCSVWWLSIRCLCVRYLSLRCLCVRYLSLRCLCVRYLSVRCLSERCLSVRCLSVRCLSLGCLCVRCLSLRCLSVYDAFTYINAFRL